MPVVSFMKILFASRKTGFLFISEALALFSFLAHQLFFVRKNETINTGFDFLFIAATLCLLVLIFAGMSKALDLYSSFLAAKTHSEKPELTRDIILTLSPFNILYLIFLQHVIYLRDLTIALLFLSSAGFVYLQIIFCVRLAKSKQEEKFFQRIHAWIKLDYFSNNQILILTFVIPLILFSLLGSGLIVPKHPFTGDEPHYLIITKSILADGDINLRNNYQNKDYLDFYPGQLKPHTRPGRKGEEYQFSRHSPGLPILLVPFYYLGDKIGNVFFPENPALKIQFLVFFVRLPFWILTSLLGWSLFLLAYDLTKKRHIALLAWLFFCFTSPVIFYSQLVYPEVLAALICLHLFRQGVFKKKLEAKHSILLGLGIAYLPWLNIKYAVLVLTLFILIVYNLFRPLNRKLKPIFSFLSPICISFVLYLFYLWTHYGSLSPISPYEYSSTNTNFQFPQFMHLNGLELIRCGIGYLFDQRFGLFPYSLVYILFFPGVIYLYKKNKKEAAPLLVLLGLYWAFCSLSYYWGGYCPPGRTLFPVIWILALFAAVAYAGAKNKASTVFRRVFLFMSLSTALTAIQNPRLLYHVSPSYLPGDERFYSHFFSQFSNLFLDLKSIIPSLANKEHILWLPTLIWLPAVMLIAFVFLKKKKFREDKKTLKKLSLHTVFVFVLSIFCLGYIFFNIKLDYGISYEGKNYELFFQDQGNYGQELNGFWTKGKSSTGVVLKSPTRVSEIRLNVSSQIKGQTQIRVGNFRTIIERQNSLSLGNSLIVHSPVGFPWKDGYIYYIRLKENNGFSPLRLNNKLKDDRFLGVFVEISTK